MKLNHLTTDAAVHRQEKDQRGAVTTLEVLGQEGKLVATDCLRLNSFAPVAKSINPRWKSDVFKCEKEHKQPFRS